MKRKITIVMLLVFLIGMLATSVSAAGAASLAVSSATVYRGSTVTVVAKVSGVGTCTAGSAEVSYGSGLEWTGVTSKNSGVTIDYKLDEGRIIFYSMSGANVNGDLLALTFKVKSNAAFADNKISVKFAINGENLSASATVNVSCNHKFSNWAHYSATTHIHKCSICGKAETAEHSYDNDCDPTCNGCGGERTISHKFGEEWISDENGHWHACTVCGEKADTANHTPGEPAGEYTDQTCTICQYVLAPALGHTHKYDKTFAHDDKGHWQVCTGCQEPTEAEDHSFDGDCDETCDKCGYQRQITHALGDWEYTEDAHWRTCDSCSMKLEEGQHSWDAGFVKTQATTAKTGLIIYRCTDCMAQRQEVIPKALPTDPAGGWAWWIWMTIGFAGGAILAVGVGVLIIALSVKKKSKGRFSG